MNELPPLSGSYFAGKMETLVLAMVLALVDDDKSVSVQAVWKPGVSTVIRVTVSQKDLGKVIGKQGRTARSLRTILAAAGQKHKQSYSLDIVAAS